MDPNDEREAVASGAAAMNDDPIAVRAALGPDGVTWVAMGTDTTLTAAGGRRAARLDAGGVSDGTC